MNDSVSIYLEKALECIADASHTFNEASDFVNAIHDFLKNR